MIEVEGLRYQYRVDAPEVLHGLTFAIHPGEVFGFLGPSGAGKSTTQNILIRLLKGYQGKIKMLGKPLPQWGNELYEQVGISFELPNHYLKLTARENLAYFAALYHAKTLTVEGVLDSVGLLAAADERVANFSKGMKNRLSVARALLHQPALLFLDEPTSGLDPVSTQRIKTLILAQKAAGRTVVLNTHNMAIAEQLCDRVAFIVDGQIREIAPPQTLKEAYGEATVAVTFAGSPEPALYPLEGLGQNPAFLQRLAAEGVTAIHSREASLEDVFIRVTGSDLGTGDS